MAQNPMTSPGSSLREGARLWKQALKDSNDLGLLGGVTGRLCKGSVGRQVSDVNAWLPADEPG